MLSIKNLSEKDLKETESILNKFVPYAQKQLGYDQPVKLMFISDPDNAVNPLGKTAHYQPGTKAITVYVDDRHPKDIMRSVSHELVHHAQNCRGEFDKTPAMGEGYAQADEHLREMEREAYEKGNLIFRDFTDGLKSNDEQITIYIDDSTDNQSANLHEEKKMKKNKFGLSSPHLKWQAFLLNEGSDNQKQKWMQAFQNAAGNPQPPPRDFWDTATYLYSKGGDPVEAGKQYAANNLSESSLPEDARSRFAQEMASQMKNQPVKMYDDSSAIVMLFGDRDNEGYGHDSSKVHMHMSDQGPVAYAYAAGKQINDPSQAAKAMDAFLDAGGRRALRQAEKSKMNEASDQNVDIIGSLINQHGFMNVREPLEQMGFTVDFVTEPLPMYNLTKDGMKYAALNKKYVEDPDLVVGDTAIGAMNEGDSPKKDVGATGKDSHWLPEAHGAEHEEVGGWGEIHGSASEEAPSREQALEALVDLDKTVKNYLQSSDEVAQRDGKDLSQIRNMFAKEFNGGRAPGKFSQELKNAVANLDTIVRDEIPQDLYYALHPEVLEEYGDHETQASGGLVASGHSTEPSMDFVEDIALDVINGGGSLMQIATALQDQGFDASLSTGALMIKGTEREKFFIGKASDFDIDPSEETRQIGPYVLGFMDSSMNEASPKSWAEAGTEDAQKGRSPSPPSSKGKGLGRRDWNEYMDAYKAAAGQTVGGSTGAHMNEMYGEDDDYFMELEREFPFLSKAVKAGEVPEEVAVDIAKEYGSKEDMPNGEELKQSLREVVRKSLMEKLSGEQSKLDKDKDGDIGADDLANLRSKKK